MLNTYRTVIQNAPWQPLLDNNETKTNVHIHTYTLVYKPTYVHAYYKQIKNVYQACYSSIMKRYEIYLTVHSNSQEQITGIQAQGKRKLHITEHIQLTVS